MWGSSLHHSLLEPIYLIFWGYFTSICPRLLNEYKTCVPVFPQKHKNTSYNYYQEHITFWCNLAICWRAFNHCVAFRMLGVSGHWGECKCVCSMPNVCCVSHHWFVHKLDNDNYFLFSSREGLKGQLSIFTTQVLLELPKVARSSHVYLFYPWTEPSSRNSAQLLFSSHCNLCSPVYCWFESNYM